MKFTQDIVLLTNHISQIEKEKAALEKKLSELEFDSQSKEKYKESLKENNELETENLGAIYFEIENIRKILEDYDKILMEKKNQIRKIESEIRNIGMNSKYNMENYFEMENKNKQLQKEIEEVREEFKKSKNSGSSNVFKSNYLEKPQEKKHSYDYNKNIDKFERPRRDLINNNSLSVKSIEQKEFNHNEKYSELQSNDLSFSRNKNLRDLNV
jgi:chromosome segregation ATPase